MERFLLDKAIDVGVTYRAEMDKAFVIKAAGTNSAGKAILSVAGSPVLELKSAVAPIAKINTNMNSLLSLEPVPIVVPPGKPFSFTGDTDSEIRIKGHILVLGIGEVLPIGLLARFGEQHKKYKMYLEGSYTSAAAVTIPASAEYPVLTWTVPAGEKYSFAELYMGEVWTTAGTIPREDLATRIYIDDRPRDVIEEVMADWGIYSTAAPRLPREDLNMEPFSLAEMPLELVAGRTLKITCINIGIARTLAAGETLRALVEVVGIKEIL